LEISKSHVATILLTMPLGVPDRAGVEQMDLEVSANFNYSVIPFGAVFM